MTRPEHISITRPEDGEFGLGQYNNGMETLPGPKIKVRACHIATATTIISSKNKLLITMLIPI